MPILAGLIAAVAVATLASMPFFSSLSALVNQVVRFHLAAAKVAQSDNLGILGQFIAANGVLGVAAVLGALLACLRRDGRVIPLLAWLATTIVLLAMQFPLFPHHLLVLVPPLIALAPMGPGDSPSLKPVPEILRARLLSAQAAGLLMGLLVLAAVATGIAGSYGYYQKQSSHAEGVARATAEITADLRGLTRPDQWIVTDAQFIVALADRDSPPSLADTSQTRILAGYLTTPELLSDASNPRVHAVLFATNRLAFGPTADFHDWVSQHFALARRYGPGVELWTR